MPHMHARDMSTPPMSVCGASGGIIALCNWGHMDPVRGGVALITSRIVSHLGKYGIQGKDDIFEAHTHEEASKAPSIHWTEPQPRDLHFRGHGFRRAQRGWRKMSQNMADGAFFFFFPITVIYTVQSGYRMLSASEASTANQISSPRSPDIARMDWGLNAACGQPPGSAFFFPATQQ
ncbi:hypothetical protein BS47DRAFT_1452549 [Hydnum rufescens UP504]|uniref:Uncharacterized protein n=1 Tax=Hydnum rufescens UP504 TaxID=1448309 RepID=A0A9P6AZB8_9AGAM|nr:hypothetical protein BS47DRAFT_1452549 [Hydnum rufescens UP504]